MRQERQGYSDRDSWQTQDAKSHFSEVIRRAVQERDQFIKHRGEEVAVIVSKSKYDELMAPSCSLLDIFYSAPDEIADLIVERSLDVPR